MTKLYNTKAGPVARRGDAYTLLNGHSWDALFNGTEIEEELEHTLMVMRATGAGACEAACVEAGNLLPPIGSQEVWAAGVTYLRSREARMEESKDAGGGSFYDRVYAADRPELFFKATPHRVVGPGGRVRIRRDSKWNVPEPELALAVNSAGRIVGYTIGNDMSSRDIEGENPLYLPQAKVYDGCCALGPAVLLTPDPLPKATEIRLQVLRAGGEAFAGKTAISQIKRSFEQLVEYLFRDNSFPHGCFLLTGTGVVPPDSFTLQAGDEVRITIDPIGTLANVVG